MGDWYYLRYGHLAVRWDDESSWFLTVDESLSHGSSNNFEGLCGNYNGNPYGTTVITPYLHLLYLLHNKLYNKDQSKFAQLLDSSFVFARWQHRRTGDRAETCNFYFWLGISPSCGG